MKVHIPEISVVHQQLFSRHQKTPKPNIAETNVSLHLDSIVQRIWTLS